MEQSDAALLEQWVNQRDAEAMAQIVARHSRMVYATCRRILGSGAEAADATQECFLRLASVRRAGPSLPGLLHTTATRLALNHLRAESRRRERERQYVETLNPAQEARWDDVQAYVDEAIEALDENSRAPLIRHFLQGETHESIARDLGISRAGVTYRIDRGIREVRERLRRKGIAVAAPALAGMLVTAAESAEALPAELILDLGRTAIAGATPRSAYSHLLTGKRALLVKTAAIAAGIVALSAVYTTLQSKNEPDSPPPSIAAAAPVQGSAQPQPPNAAPAAALTPEPRKAHPATVELTVRSDTGYPRPDVHVFEEWPILGPQSDINGRIGLTVEAGAPAAYAAFSLNTSRSALFTVAPGTRNMVVALTCNTIEVSGRLFDDAGGLIPLAAVQLRIADPEGLEYVSNPLLSDVQGYYECDKVPADGGYTLQARVVMPQHEPPLEWSAPVELAFNAYHVELPDLTIPADAAQKAAHNKLFLEMSECSSQYYTHAGTAMRYGGVVKDTRGQPVPGALVELKYELEDVAVVFLRRAATDAQGRWSRLLPEDLAHLDVTVKHENYLKTACDSKTVVATRRPPGNVADNAAVTVLHRGIHVAGVVRDRSGRPVPDALVYHTLDARAPGGRLTTGWPTEDMTSTRTASDGTFALNCIPPGNQQLNVRQHGYAPAVFPFEAADGNPSLNITLLDGGTIRGRVVNQAGEPVQGAQVRSEGTSTETDTSGAFVIENVPVTKTWVQFEASGYYLSQHEIIARDEPYEFIVYKPITFTGQVIDAVTGKPVTEFEARTCRLMQGQDTLHWLSTSPGETCSSPQGDFKKDLVEVNVQNQDTDQYAIEINAKGYFPASSPPIHLSDPVEPLTIVLIGGETVSGSVLQPDGMPAVGAEVVCTLPGSFYIVQQGQLGLALLRDPSRYQKTGIDGKFELAGSPEPPGLLAVHQTGFALFAPSEFTNGSTVTLTQWATVSGAVYRGDAPEPGAQLAVLPQSATSANPVHWIWYEPTGPDGSFELTRVPALPLIIGRYSLSAGHLDVSHAVPIHPAPGEHVVVQIGGTGGTVTGHIDHDIAPTDNLRVLAISRQEPPMTYAAKVETNGLFQINDIPPGQYNLTAELYAPPQNNQGEWPLIATAQRDFEVTNETQPLDLDEIYLHP